MVFETFSLMVIVQNLAKVSDGGSRMAFCDWQAGLVGKIANDGAKMDTRVETQNLQRLLNNHSREQDAPIIWQSPLTIMQFSPLPGDCVTAASISNGKHKSTGHTYTHQKSNPVRPREESRREEKRNAQAGRDPGDNQRPSGK